MINMALGLLCIIAIILPISAYLNWKMDFKLVEGKYIKKKNPTSDMLYRIKSWNFDSVTYEEFKYDSGSNISESNIVTSLKRNFFNEFEEKVGIFK